MSAQSERTIAILYSGFYRGRGEGVVQHITQLERTLPAFGHHVTVLSLESVGIPARFVPHAIQYAVSAVAPPTGHYWRLAVGRRLLRIAFGRLQATKRPDAVIFEDVYLPFATGLPSLVMLHALQSDMMQHLRLRREALQLARRLDAGAIVRCPYPVAVVSEPYRAHVAAVVREAGADPTELDVIPLGVDADAFPDPPEPRLSQELCLVFVGFLEARKNVLFLVDVMDELRARYGGPTRLTVAGDGPLRADLERAIAARRLEPWMRLVGRVRRPEVPRLLRSQHLMLHPSLKESFSQTLLEGKLAGLRTLATAGLEVPDEFIDVPLPLDARAWAKAVADLAPSVLGATADPARVAELRLLRKRYSRQAMVDRTLRKLFPA